MHLARNTYLLVVLATGAAGAGLQRWQPDLAAAILAASAGGVLALLLTLWGLALATYQILPRVGYAAERWSWQCSVGSTGSTGGSDSK